jgi:hypothetical protein
MHYENDKLYEAIKSAVEYAFSVCGVEGFKRTSMFLSNEKK